MELTKLTFTDYPEHTVVQYADAPFFYAYKISQEDNGLNCLDVLELELASADEVPDWTSDYVGICDMPDEEDFPRIVAHLEAMPEPDRNDPRINPDCDAARRMFGQTPGDIDPNA